MRDLSSLFLWGTEGYFSFFLYKETWLFPCAHDCFWDLISLGRKTKPCLEYCRKSLYQDRFLASSGFSKKCTYARMSWAFRDPKNMCRGGSRFLCHLQPRDSPKSTLWRMWKKTVQRTPLFFHLATKPIKLLPRHLITFHTRLRTDIQVRHDDN